MFEFHSNLATSRYRTTDDGTQPTRGAIHETLETTHGFTDWFEVAVYVYVQPCAIGRRLP